jgi:hypothetical protein
MDWFGKIIKRRATPPYKHVRAKRSTSSRRMVLTIAAIATSFAFVASLAQTSRAEVGAVSSGSSDSTIQTLNTGSTDSLVSVTDGTSRPLGATTTTAITFSDGSDIHPAPETTGSTSSSTGEVGSSSTEVISALQLDQTTSSLRPAPNDSSNGVDLVPTVEPSSTLAAETIATNSPTTHPATSSSSLAAISTSIQPLAVPTSTTSETTSSTSPSALTSNNSTTSPASFTSTTDHATSSTTSTAAQTSTTLGAMDSRYGLECVWVVADADAKASNGMQYGPLTPSVGEKQFPAPTGPCVVSVGSALQARYGRHALRVNPIGELGTGRMIELWILSTTAKKGTPSPVITWKLSEPNGTIAQTGETKADVGLVCGDSQAVPQPTSLTSTVSSVAGATGSQLVADAQASQSAAAMIVTRCVEHGILLARHQFQLSPQAPCGEYQLETSLLASDLPNVRTLTIDVECITSFSFDFEKLRWPELGTGENILLGDTTYGGELPTVRNTGNVGVTINAIFEKFRPTSDTAIGPSVPAAKGSKAVDPLSSDSITAWVSRNTATNSLDRANTADLRRSEVLCPGETGSFNVVVLTDDGARKGNYAGSMSLVAQRWFQPSPDLAQTAQKPSSARSSLFTKPAATCAEDQDSLYPDWSK